MPEWLIPLIVAIAAPGGIGAGFFLYRREGKKAPIEHEALQVAQALKLSTTAGELFSVVSARLQVQDLRVLAQDEKIDRQDDKIDNQNVKIGRLEIKNERGDHRLVVWHAWYAEKFSHWETLRMVLYPPEPPEPIVDARLSMLETQPNKE